MTHVDSIWMWLPGSKEWICYAKTEQSAAVKPDNYIQPPTANHTFLILYDYSPGYFIDNGYEPERQKLMDAFAEILRQNAKSIKQTQSKDPPVTTRRNLYLVQDSDRPMYVLATDWTDAHKQWETQVRSENNGDLNGDCEGISLVADSSDIVLSNFDKTDWRHKRFNEIVTNIDEQAAKIKELENKLRDKLGRIKILSDNLDLTNAHDSQCIEKLQNRNRGLESQLAAANRREQILIDIRKTLEKRIDMLGEIITKDTTTIAKLESRLHGIKAVVIQPES